MRRFLIVGTLIMLTHFAYSQEVDFKKNTVLVDGKECIKMSNEDAVSVSYSDMEGNELIMMRFIHGSRYGSVYNKVVFVNEKLSFTSQSYVYTKKMLIKRLVKDKVIENCKINRENLEKFIMKYDENVEKAGN
ncbi:MAG: hypothetical protein JST02_11345 [Bacteroidetes bacterium]|nr:hypothetical protein [Bacteroidota bacterium]